MARFLAAALLLATMALQPIVAAASRSTAAGGTPKAQGILLRSGSARWISVDSPLNSAPAEERVDRDGFSGVSFNGDDGPNSWLVGWIEKMPSIRSGTMSARKPAM